jgi:hypothetical protein
MDASVLPSNSVVECLQKHFTFLLKLPVHLKNTTNKKQTRQKPKMSSINSFIVGFQAVVRVAVARIL